MATALLIDDSEFMRALLKTIVAKHDIETIAEANNGILGVEKYKEVKPDIVFMDIMMDEMNGVEALRNIIEHDKNAKVIMVSSMMTQKPFLDEAMEIGAKEVINKPFNEKEVANVLKKL